MKNSESCEFKKGVICTNKEFIREVYEKGELIEGKMPGIYKFNGKDFFVINEETMRIDTCESCPYQSLEALAEIKV